MPKEKQTTDPHERLLDALRELHNIAAELAMNNFPVSANTIRRHTSDIWDELYGNLSPRPKFLT